MEQKEFIEKIKQLFNYHQQISIIEALYLMFEIHKGQLRLPQKTPYALHPLEVANIVIDFLNKPSEQLVIAALLHDTLEDQPAKLAKKYVTNYSNQTNLSSKQAAFLFIKFKFGTKVAEIVELLSNPDFESELSLIGINSDNPHFRTEKNKLYSDHIKEIAKNPEAIIIKIADFIYNANDLIPLPDSLQKMSLIQKYTPIPDILLAAIHTRKLPLKKPAQKMILSRLQTIKNYLHSH